MNCDLCIHKDVCHAVAECFTAIPGFDCHSFLPDKKSVPDRPRANWGEWIISEIRCPECLEYFDTECYSKEELNRCPNCGAELRGTK